MPPKSQQGTARGPYSSLSHSNPPGIGNGTGGSSIDQGDVSRGVGSSRALSGLQSNNSSSSSSSTSITNRNVGTRVTSNLSSNDQVALNRKTGNGKNSNQNQSASSRVVQEIFGIFTVTLVVFFHILVGQIRSLLMMVSMKI